MICGCAVRQNNVQAEPNQQIIERTLVREIADGRLVELYHEYMTVSQGAIGYNWIIINNVKESNEKFRIIPCEVCSFPETEFSIGAGSYRIVRFSVKPEEGQHMIRVVDKFNNAYGYAKMNVNKD
jgi:hypothetical protein